MRAVSAYVLKRRRGLSLEQVQSQIDTLTRDVRALSLAQQQVKEAERRADDADKKLAAVTAELSQVRASTSWRLTAPLRAGLSMARSMVSVQSARATARQALGGAVRTVMRLYGKAPLSASQREAVRRAFARVAPGLYKTLLRQVGAPAVLPGQRPDPNDLHWLYDLVDETAMRAGLWRLQHKLAAHTRVHGPVSHIIVLPFLASGGAEQTALNFSRQIVSAGGSVMLVAADRAVQSTSVPTLPSGVMQVDLSEHFPDADLHAREALLLAIIRMTGPRVLHLINSEAAWRLVIKVPARIRRQCRIFASIFAMQYDWRTGARIGYAETFLRAALPHLDGVLSDNYRFVEDATSIYQLDEQRTQFHVIYNPSRVEPDGAVEARLKVLASEIAAAPRLQVMWAGRLDAEKRPDLLRQVAQRCPHMDFHVYGAGVVDSAGASLAASCENLQMHGPYSSPIEVFEARPHHVFMFTSRWEGMPNTLLEFGALGIPIVAATVGGVSELIDEKTGFPVSARPSPDEYVASLERIHAAPHQAVQRARLLMCRVATRHSEEAFAQSVRAVPGYLSAMPKGDRL